MDIMIMIVVTKIQKKNGKICGIMCGKIEKLSDLNKNWCGSRYGPCNYDSGNKKIKRQKDTKTQRQKDKKDKEKTKDKKKYKKDKKYKKNTNKRQKDRGPEGPPCPPQELEQGGHRPPKF